MVASTSRSICLFSSHSLADPRIGAWTYVDPLQAMNDYNTAPSLVLSAEVARVGKPYQIKIYPPYGTTVDDGHGGLHAEGRVAGRPG